MNIQYSVARGAMSQIAAQFEAGSIDMFGVTLEDWKKLSAAKPWIANDRTRMAFIFNSLMSSTTNVIGVPAFQMPAEYIAAGIALYVHPINVHAACRFLERLPTAEEQGRAVEGTDKVTAAQLFALVVQLMADPQRSHAVAMFEKYTNLRIGQSQYAEDAPQKQKGGR